MNKVHVTRAQLLANKAQIALADKGLELLAQKRAALLRELMSTADRAMVQRDALEEAVGRARRALALAEGLDGEAAVRSAALAAGSEIPLDVRSHSIMGVAVPVIQRRTVARSLLGRGYALAGTTAAIDEAAAAYEAAVDALIELADSELRLRPLAEEIQRTTRRANALEQLIIPRLHAENRHIEQALEERERGAHYRLRQVQKRLARRRRRG